jgi:hypothetical protein
MVPRAVERGGDAPDLVGSLATAVAQTRGGLVPRVAERGVTSIRLGYAAEHFSRYDGACFAKVQLPARSAPMK